MFQGEDVGHAEGLQIGGGRRRAEESWEKLSGAIPRARANSPVYGARAGSPTLRNPPFPALALYFQEYLTIGALASAAHSWVDPSYTFTFWYPRTSERTNHQPEQTRPVSQ